MSTSFGADRTHEMLANMVGRLWVGMIAFRFGLPENTTFPLLSLPLYAPAFLQAMIAFWGAFLFLEMLSLLPLAAKFKRAFRQFGLAWLVVYPAVYGLFLFLVALAVTIPVTDMVSVPLFIAGTFTILGYYVNYIMKGTFFRALRQIVNGVWGWAVARLDSANRFIYQIL